MKMIISAATDVGLRKSINQDSVYINSRNTKSGDIAFAIVCDGMGGHSQGEIASTSVVSAFAGWEMNTLPSLLCGEIDDSIIREQWSNILYAQNKKLYEYGQSNGIKTGTTVTAMLITVSRWYCVNIGDTRAYEINSAATQLTVDHSFVEQEIQRGNMTREQSKSSPKGNILTRCVGITPSAQPDFYFGVPRHNTTYMICSDGFRHCITKEEMVQHLNPADIQNSEQLKQSQEYLAEINKNRGEKDNITAASIVCTA